MRWVLVAYKITRVCEVWRNRGRWAREGTVFDGCDGATVLERFPLGDKSIKISGKEAPCGYALFACTMAESRRLSRVDGVGLYHTQALPLVELSS